MKTDLLVAAFLFVGFAALEPALINGDGLSYACDSLGPVLSTVQPKHILIGPALKVVALAAQSLGLESQTLRAFQLFNHVWGVGIYWLLARSVYPRVAPGGFVSRACALGTVLSFGVFSRSCDLEVYAPALFFDVAILAYLLDHDPARPRHAAAAGLLFAVAVGFHVTNVLMLPAIVILFVARTRGSSRWPAFLAASSSVMAGAVLLALLVLSRDGLGHWPPRFALLFPEADAQPEQSIPVRLARGVYGLVRSVVFLPYIRDLRPAVAGLAAGWCVVAGGLTCYLGSWARLWETRKTLFAGVVAAALPFLAIGLIYYPSDPERWLFLTPVVWLVVAIAWNDAASDSRRVRVMLGGLVATLGVFNAGFGLVPDASGSRFVNGLRSLERRAGAGDLVITVAGVRNAALAFYLPKRLECDTVVFMDLVKRHRSDVAALQAELRDAVDTRLREGGRVLVFNVQGERMVPGEGYPWSHTTVFGIGPSTLTEVLDGYQATTLVVPGADTVGLIQLAPKSAPEVLTRHPAGS